MDEVFLSYARSDEAVAKRVAAKLEAAGYSVWWDQQLAAHQPYSDIIQGHLSAAKAVVVLWSDDAAASQWVRAEADVARVAGKLIQARLDAHPLPLPFNQIQCVDLSKWRGNDSHAGWRRLLSSVATLAGGEAPGRAARVPGESGWNRWRLGAALLAAAVMAAVALFVLRPTLLGGPRPEGPTRLVVLPFRAAAAGDEALASGLWEDTRHALSRNPALLILGPHSSASVAAADMDPKAARKKLGVQYLLDADLRRVGDRIRLATSLVRTEDGAEVWSENLDGKLDDVFALQARLASEIEGRIRGRLAKGGGTRPQNITTSGAVYALYSQARASLRERDEASIDAAEHQLRQAVALDPNYAPAWASLAVAEYLGIRGLENLKVRSGEAEKHARRAITLAPNLAAAHAALALVLDLEGPVAEAELRRAVQLDGNDVENLTWLANMSADQNRAKEALRLYGRALEIEPLWWPASLNKIDVLLASRDFGSAQEEIERLERAGKPSLAKHARILLLDARGDLSEAARLAIQLFKNGSPADREEISYELQHLLISLGHLDQAARLPMIPSFGPPLWRNDPRPYEEFARRNFQPGQLWSIYPLAASVARAYLMIGKDAELRRLYAEVGGTPRDLRSKARSNVNFMIVAPYVATALANGGSDDEARRLLAAADAIVQAWARNGPLPPRRLALLARIRSAQGHGEEAARMLLAAVKAGYVPDFPALAIDFEQDGALARLKPLPEFQRARSMLLGRLARERSELGPVELR
jgi:TolB-like protein/Tfp pilus assembly protein PilF